MKGDAACRIRRRIETFPAPIRAVAVREIEAHPPELDEAEHHAAASAAMSARIAVVRAPHGLAAHGVDAVTLGGVVYLERLSDPWRELVAVVHEASHWALGRQRHSHGDVWVVTALAIEGLDPKT